MGTLSRRFLSRVSVAIGFGRDRYADFCFRYNLAGAKEGRIAAETARQHEYGNRTDEDKRRDLTRAPTGYARCHGP